MMHHPSSAPLKYSSHCEYDFRAPARRGNREESRVFRPREGAQVDRGRRARFGRQRGLRSADAERALPHAALEVRAAHPGCKRWTRPAQKRTQDTPHQAPHVPVQDVGRLFVITVSLRTQDARLATHSCPPSLGYSKCLTIVSAHLRTLRQFRRDARDCTALQSGPAMEHIGAAASNEHGDRGMCIRPTRYIALANLRARSDINRRQDGRCTLRRTSDQQ